MVYKKDEPLFYSKFRFWTANGWAIHQWKKKCYVRIKTNDYFWGFIGKWLSHWRFKIWIVSKKVHPFCLQGLLCRFDRLWGSLLYGRNTSFVKSTMKYYSQERVIYENMCQISLHQKTLEKSFFFFSIWSSV